MAALASSLSGLLDILKLFCFLKLKFIFFIKYLQNYQLKSLNVAAIDSSNYNYFAVLFYLPVYLPKISSMNFSQAISKLKSMLMANNNSNSRQYHKSWLVF